ncbi:hypothetical protein MUK42_34579 [Musa troglodytarum]|uniref:Uncharacterized protein n=1 Tax=Musa troglodytarum TaxID=320322 RepID=A0A9E7H8I5_9LILI|nr:hypothetical protein MUK42_34579 [Musa troglodytarum]
MPSAIFICGHLGASLISSSRERAFLVSGARVPSVEGTRSEGVAGFLQRDQGDEGEGSALVPEAEAASGDRYIKKHIETSSIHPLYHNTLLEIQCAKDICKMTGICLDRLSNVAGAPVFYQYCRFSSLSKV